MCVVARCSGYRLNLVMIISSLDRLKIWAFIDAIR